MVESIGKILVVEDERIVAEDIAETLEAAGFEATGIAGSYEEALNLIDTEVPDLVLMDIVLQGSRDGIETAEEIRKQHGIPVIYMTAYSDDQTLERAARSEPHGYIVKPFADRDLYSAVKVALYKSEMERKLKQRERWYGTLFRSVGDAMVTTDAKGQINMINPAAEQLLGTSVGVDGGLMVGEVIRFRSRHTREILPSIFDPILEGADEIILPRDVEILSALGKSCPVSGSVSAIRDSDGSRLGAVLVLTDETERQGAEAALLQSERMAAVGTLVSGIAHEFNNINSAILGFLDLTLLEEELTGAARENIEVAVAAGKRGAEITRNLLTFSRKSTQARSVIDMVEVVDEVVELMSVKFLKADIQLTLELCRGAQVEGDSGQLGQLLMNLLINAEHALVNVDRKNITIGLDVVEDAVVMSVRDNGRGMSEEVQQQIFLPFFSTKGVYAKDTLSEASVEGSGLGLSVCQTIVENHQGSITVSSVKQEGSCFVVRFPRASESCREPSVEVGGEQADRPGIQVMVVDDEPDLRRVLEATLRAKGFEVKASSDAEAALEMIEGVDVVLLDLHMRGLDGYGFMERLGKRPPEERPAVLVVTGKAIQDEAELHAVYPIAGLVRKPWSTRELVRAVNRTVAKEKV